MAVSQIPEGPSKAVVVAGRLLSAATGAVMRIEASEALTTEPVMLPTGSA